MCNRNNCECLHEILEKILFLQTNDDECCDQNSCTKPFLGPSFSPICFNTRPVSFYSCCNGNLWEFPYTIGETTGTSSIFRVESLDDCCCTCRVLALTDPTSTTSPYTATDSFFTINLNCVSAIKCSNDVFVACS